MSTYAVAHLRNVRMGPEIVEYLERIYQAILRLRTDNAEPDVVFADRVTEGHRATDVLHG